jgi:hypothetical protein
MGLQVPFELCYPPQAASAVRDKLHVIVIDRPHKKDRPHYNSKGDDYTHPSPSASQACPQSWRDRTPTVFLLAEIAPRADCSDEPAQDDGQKTPDQEPESVRRRRRHQGEPGPRREMEKVNEHTRISNCLFVSAACPVGEPVRSHPELGESIGIRRRSWWGSDR